LTENHDIVGGAILDVYQEEFVAEDLARGFVDACVRHGVVSIMDETKSAGRAGPLGITGERGLLPDLVVLGKAIANGAALSVLVTREYDPVCFREARVGGTYAKERLGVAAGLATTRIMKEREGYARLREQSGRMCRLLEEVSAEAGTGWALDTVACLGGGGFDLRVSNNVGDVLQAKWDLQRRLQDEGVLLLVGHPSFVTLAHDAVSDDWIRGAAARALKSWRHGISERR
jgi:glutamate-1-semialdehyde 2,1-aminomutase